MRRVWIVILALFLFVIAARGIGLVALIQHYPTLAVVNPAGCALDYDEHWRLTDSRGNVTLETQNEAEAGIALLVCE